MVKVSGLVLDNLHRHHLVCFHVLTLDHLPKGALAKNVKNQVSVTRSGDARTEDYDNGLVSFLSPQPVVHIEDVIVVLIIVPLVMRRLARFCEDSPWVMRRLVFELGIAYAVGFGDVRRQLTQGLQHKEKR